tara:strand:- start:2360 stop:3313 length:954 start_codon:yes stop_codon:yes gene_type:complete
MVNCKICDKEFSDDTSLHRHLRAHSIRKVEYYQTHFPRYDLHTGDIIKFKSKEQYFSSDFNSRLSLKHWLKKQDPEKSKKYCHKILQDRVEKKSITYCPSQVELRTIMSPPTQYYDVLFGNFYDYCKENFKLNSKFKKISNILFENNIWKIKSKFQEPIVYVDTREQMPLKFKECEIRVKTLPFGDYCFFDNEHTHNCYVERKSIKDFIGTLSGGFERFEREIIRCQEADGYLVVLVERNLNECMAFKKLPYVSKKVRATPEYIFSNVRTLIQKYPHLQFLFVNGRKESVRVIEKMFFNGTDYKNYDLQLAYDLKIL